VIINKISLLVGGEAGEGITRSGFLFAKTCLRGGLHVFGANDYQSLIRGGHNFYVVRADIEPIYSQADTIDLLIALNKETITLHKDELVPHGGIIYDGTQTTITQEELGRNDIELYSIPLRKIVKNLEWPQIMENTVALGAATALLNYDPEILNQVLKDTFNPKIAEQNITAAKQGYDYALEHYGDNFGYRLQKTDKSGKHKIFLTGNEAVGLAAIKAGCKLYAAYPMTPATSLLHFFAPLDRQYNMIVVQVENEIAAINTVAGASYTGIRAMTATSGGGFCLMSECIGMIGMTETSPVILLAESHETANPFNQNRIPIDRGHLITHKKYMGEEKYERHKLTSNGISPRAMPGTKGAIVRTNADEHNELGYTTEDPTVTTQMADKRFKKLEALTKGLENIETIKFYGPEQAEATILAWGSTKGPIREAMKLLNKEGPKINYLQIIYLTPFPVNKVQKILKTAKKTIVIENNKTSQLTSLIREHLLITVDHQILKYDGRPFNPEALTQKIKEAL
jgi:pyruvate/2-oxoacid:ferredoxin oxidoreductase alpha subunit/Pyruvate/2-oxoacid:ferredoxin oxidoreductase gamma subunit